MQISMTFRHMDASDAMKETVEEKLSKVKKYFQGPIEANVVLSVERYLHACDVTINCGGHVYKGREESDDMYTSIDRVMDKIERQIDKNKGRIQAKRTAG
ncbi:MAG: ribosome-associated translation inhibitor RaiA [Myxococcota bacterium]|jgi:putative sigma-54 modulation protein|nr:ribosome-associated translation inhibitor RaiA [Myxococcota bacterium]